MVVAIRRDRTRETVVRLSKTLIVAATAATVLGSTSGIAGGSSARSFANCTQLNGVYPHGVGRTNARDRVRGSTSPVTNFKRSNALYAHNDGGSRRYPGERDLDRDNDGVACEKL